MNLWGFLLPSFFFFDYSWNPLGMGIFTALFQDLKIQIKGIFHAILCSKSTTVLLSIHTYISGMDQHDWLEEGWTTATKTLYQYAHSVFLQSYCIIFQLRQQFQNEIEIIAEWVRAERMHWMKTVTVRCPPTELVFSKYGGEKSLRTHSESSIHEKVITELFGKEVQ